MHDPLDLIQGCAAIGRLFHPHLNPRQVQYLASATALPVFKFAGRLCTTRSAMQGYFSKLASEALTRGPQAQPRNGTVASEERPEPAPAKPQRPRPRRRHRPKPAAKKRGEAGDAAP